MGGDGNSGPSPEKEPRSGTRTFNHSEHRVGLVQGDGETQSLTILLLLQQVGQLLPSTHTHKHISLNHPTALSGPALCLFSQILPDHWQAGGTVSGIGPNWPVLSAFWPHKELKCAKMGANVTEQTRKCLRDIINWSESWYDLGSYQTPVRCAGLCWAWPAEVRLRPTTSLFAQLETERRAGSQTDTIKGWKMTKIECHGRLSLVLGLRNLWTTNERCT